MQRQPIDIHGFSEKYLKQVIPDHSQWVDQYATLRDILG
jgi:hypothetical protein